MIQPVSGTDTNNQTMYDNLLPYGNWKIYQVDPHYHLHRNKNDHKSILESTTIIYGRLQKLYLKEPLCGSF